MLRINPRFQVGYLTLSALLVGAAILLGFDAWTSILVGLASWLVACTTYPGFEFSKDGLRMRDYHGLFGIKIGRWEKIPPVVGVTIKQFSEMIKNDSKYSAGIWNSSSTRHAELIVMLSVKHSTNGIIMGRFSIDKPEQATEFANQLAERFKVPVNSYLSNE
ncbi:hypothetical protein HHL22_02135 [Hymenobacter sp. RP-2-7]|uniref:Uncharacterized protein n=1 Tax=Hymenobacter polaris TaxID=2682546 RepID=A0A7Y0AAY8_9BACT|nr:hypothetical protein [Hymenobacter polaris]NML63994.1 hypothetical protein [Hymenobacter polaris]